METHQTAVQSALATLNALVTWLASIRNVKILALEVAASTQNAELSVTHQCVFALKVLLVILSINVSRNETTQLRIQLLVRHLLAVQTPSVENKMALVHVHALQIILEIPTKVVDLNAY